MQLPCIAPGSFLQPSRLAALVFACHDPVYGPAERWLGSCRRELLDHIIAVERHLKRPLSEYVLYHHEDQTHLRLSKETPGNRTRAITSGRVISHSRLSDLHHGYE